MMVIPNGIALVCLVPARVKYVFRDLGFRDLGFRVWSFGFFCHASKGVQSQLQEHASWRQSGRFPVIASGAAMLDLYYDIHLHVL